MSKSVQPSETRSSRNLRAASTFSASAGDGLWNTQSHSTSQAARLNLSSPVSDESTAAISSAWACRPSASIDADVSAKSSNSMGSPSGSTSRNRSLLSAGGVTISMK